MLLAFAGYSTVFAQPTDNTRFIAFGNIQTQQLDLMSTRTPTSSGRIILKYTPTAGTTADAAVTQLRTIMNAIGTVDLLTGGYNVANIEQKVGDRLTTLNYHNTTTCIKAFIGYGTNYRVTSLTPGTQYAFAVLDYNYDAQNNQLKFWQNPAGTAWPHTSNPRAVKTLGAYYTPPEISVAAVYATGVTIKT